MQNSFEYIKGSKPLLISMPHNSSLIPDELTKRLSNHAKSSVDTDWYIDRLYDFAPHLGAHIIKPKWSRYYIDLNRDPSGADLYPGADNTELCPTTDFANNALYIDKNPSANDIKKRINNTWIPYHQTIKKVLTKMVKEHGYAILYDAHSIKSVVPRFFEGTLPDFNFGTVGGKSCESSLLKSIEELDYQQWSKISNGRFKGGYITRQYGDPDNNIHAIQLELSQATYLNEDSLTWDVKKASSVKEQLKKVINAILNWKP